jgi:hypothetical protein
MKRTPSARSSSGSRRRWPTQGARISLHSVLKCCFLHCEIRPLILFKHTRTNTHKHTHTHTHTHTLPTRRDLARPAKPPAELVERIAELESQIAAARTEAESLRDRLAASVVAAGPAGDRCPECTHCYTSTSTHGDGDGDGDGDADGDGDGDGDADGDGDGDGDSGSAARNGRGSPGADAAEFAARLSAAHAERERQLEARIAGLAAERDDAAGALERAENALRREALRCKEAVGTIEVCFAAKDAELAGAKRAAAAAQQSAEDLQWLLDDERRRGAETIASLERARAEAEVEARGKMAGTACADAATSTAPLPRFDEIRERIALEVGEARAVVDALEALAVVRRRPPESPCGGAGEPREPAGDPSSDPDGDPMSEALTCTRSQSDGGIMSSSSLDADSASSALVASRGKRILGRPSPLNVDLG